MLSPTPGSPRERWRFRKSRRNREGCEYLRALGTPAHDGPHIAWHWLLSGSSLRDLTGISETFFICPFWAVLIEDYSLGNS